MIAVIRLAEARFSASTMISCSITHWLMGAQWLWMTNASHPRTDSSNRTKISPLAKSYADFAAGEVVRRLRGDRHVEVLGHFLGQLRVRPAGEQHQVLLGRPGLGAHRFGPSASAALLGSFSACSAACAAAVPGRLRATPPPMVRCLPPRGTAR